MHYCNLQTALHFLRQTQAEVERIRLVHLRDEAARSNGYRRVPKSTPNMVDFDPYALKEASQSLENAAKSLEDAISQELALRFQQEVKSRCISNWLNNC